MDINKRILKPRELEEEERRKYGFALGSAEHYQSLYEWNLLARIKELEDEVEKLTKNSDCGQATSGCVKFTYAKDRWQLEKVDGAVIAAGMGDLVIWKAD